jgi:hypothetical protein
MAAAGGFGGRRGGGGDGGGGNCMFAAHRASVELLTDVNKAYILRLELTAG